MPYSKNATKSEYLELVTDLVTDTMDISQLDTTELATFVYNSDGEPIQIDTVSSLGLRLGYEHAIIRQTYYELEVLEDAGAPLKPLRVGSKRKFYVTSVLAGLMEKIHENYEARKQLRTATAETAGFATKLQNQAPELADVFNEMLEEYLAKKNK